MKRGAHRDRTSAVRRETELSSRRGSKIECFPDFIVQLERSRIK